MTTSWVLLIAAVFVAILVASCDFKVSNVDEMKNETLMFLEGENDEDISPVIMPIFGGAVGPESFAFKGSGDEPYTGVSDERIIRWPANQSRWVDFAVTSPLRYGCEGSHDHSETEPICGRPLGLRFNERTGDLYIADAYMGLLAVGPKGGLSSPLAKEVNGVAFGFTNSLDIDPHNGTIYFTDSSTRFTRRPKNNNHQPKAWKAVVVEEDQKSKEERATPGIRIRDLDNDEDMQKGAKKMKKDGGIQDGGEPELKKEKKEDGHAGHDVSA